MTRKTGRPRGRPTKAERQRLQRLQTDALSTIEAGGGAAFLSPDEADALGIPSAPPPAPGSPSLDPEAIGRASKFLKSPYRRWITLIAKLDDGGRRTPDAVEKLIRERQRRGVKLPPEPCPGWMDEAPSAARDESRPAIEKLRPTLRTLINIVGNMRQGGVDLSPAEIAERIARKLFGLPADADPSTLWTVKDLRHRAKKQEKVRAEKYASHQAANWEEFLRDVAGRAGVDPLELVQELDRRLRKSGE